MQQDVAAVALKKTLVCMTLYLITREHVNKPLRNTPT